MVTLGVLAPPRNAVTLACVDPWQRFSFSGTSGSDDSGQDVAAEARWLVLSPSQFVDAGLGAMLPIPIAMKLGTSEDGRLVCTGLRLGAEDAPGFDPTPLEITATILHRIPLGRIVDQLAKLRAARTGEMQKIQSRLDSMVTEHGRSAIRRGPRGHTPEFWEGIATVYREALVASPHRTARYVAEHALKEDGRPFYAETDLEHMWQDRERYARKLVKIARQKGHLGPARAGKAGEFSDSGPFRNTGQGSPKRRKEKP